ncbi:MAG TPA: FAD-binding oxidoreductase [Streptosporangiaceae bacterium]|nr:FAD-binding oxidoreductase [Streptosporangiaceae bacterium]
MPAGAAAGPAARQYVVIGAGVLGVTLTSRLAKAAGPGVRVTLLEQNQPGSAATRSSFAWLNSNNKVPRAYHDLNHAGLRAWSGLAGSLDRPDWYRPSGNLEWAGTAGTAAELSARVDRLADWGYPAHLISVADAAELDPALRLPSDAPAVAWFPEEGYLLTGPMIAELTGLARQHGATVLTGEGGHVTGLDVADGQVRAVRTAAGQVIPADVVVCCAGRWVPELAALAGSGHPLPLVPWSPPGAEAPGLVVEAGPVEPGPAGAGPARMVHAPDVHFRPHTGGLVHLEAPDVHADLHTAEPHLGDLADELLARARRVTRRLDRAQVTGYRVCVRPMPADGQSIVGWLPGTGNLYVVVTHSGVTLGAHLAELMTGELLAGLRTEELEPYRPGRFLSAAS